MATRNVAFNVGKIVTTTDPYKVGSGSNYANC